MNSEFYSLTTNWTLFVLIMMAAATLWLYKIGKASGTKMAIVGLLFFVLIVFLHWGFGGQNFPGKHITGGQYYALILSSAGAVVLLFFLTSRSNFDRLSQEHIQLAQGLRVFVGGGFLMEGVLGVIPGWFSIMDGFMHIASGFFALLAAVAYLKNEPFKNGLLWLANIIGLLDIIIIVTSICFVVWNDLGPHHNMNYVVFGAGPVLLWLHFTSLRKLLSTQIAPSHHAYIPG